jgi:L-threonylcarbamoyladenylate synthase
MEIIRIEPSNPAPEAIQAAADCIAAGRVVAFPSDTCYGLAVDPTNPAAMRKLYQIKARPQEKAVSCVFRSIDAIGEWAELIAELRAVLKNNLPGSFTFLLKPTGAYPLDGLVGARIPDHPFTQALSEAIGQFTATSANRSGEPPCYSIGEMLAQLKNGELPDLTIDIGLLSVVPPSTVVNLTTSPPTIVRQGGGVFTIEVKLQL